MTKTPGALLSCPGLPPRHFAAAPEEAECLGPSHRDFAAQPEEAASLGPLPRDFAAPLEEADSLGSHPMGVWQLPEQAPGQGAPMAPWDWPAVA